MKAAERIKLKKEAQELNTDNIIASEGTELLPSSANIYIMIILYGCSNCV